MTVTVWDGESEQPGQVSLWDGDTELPVASLHSLPRDHHRYTVADMDAQITNGEPVYWAHRGGSIDWSEMTMRAYTNAVWWGARALEVSCHRSSDGVWIMHHDPTTTRVTDISHTIAATPAASLLGIPVTAPIPGGVIGRLEDVLDAYSDLLLILDNKPGTHLDEFYSLIKARVPNWSEHVIIKIFAGSPPETFQAAKEAGFRVASYLYDDILHYLEDIDPWVDYHGLNEDAPVEAWNTVLATGKPMWGHVCATPIHAATAIAKGASIVQCSGVQAIIPRVPTP